MVTATDMMDPSHAPRVNVLASEVFVTSPQPGTGVTAASHYTQSRGDDLLANIIEFTATGDVQSRPRPRHGPRARQSAVNRLVVESSVQLTAILDAPGKCA